MEVSEDIAELLVSLRSVASGAAPSRRTFPNLELGRVVFGCPLESDLKGGGRVSQYVAAHPLYPAGVVFDECWLSGQSLRKWKAPGLRVRYNYDVLFGGVQVAETPGQQETLAPGQKILFLHADICRSDLDVEIEGAAWRLSARVPA